MLLEADDAPEEDELVNEPVGLLHRADAETLGERLLLLMLLPGLLSLS